MQYTKEEQYHIWLSCVKGMTSRRFSAIIDEAGSAEAVFDSPSCVKHICDDKLFSSIANSKALGEADSVIEQMDKNGVTAVTNANESYPQCLSEIHDPPVTLFVKGNLSALYSERPFAVVGTRRPTFDGKKSAAQFTKVLAENDVTVVSGLAAGIDSCAHAACLDTGGCTIAVLGNGLSSVYPPENAALAQRIIDNGGCLVSEMRLDEKPSRFSFPQRNRIIAGLSKGVLVVEGDIKSGSLITASIALDEARDVFAIPGSIYNVMAGGPNSLIQNGAYMALSPYDILESMRWGARPGCAKAENKLPDLDENEKKIYYVLKREALSFGELENVTGFSPSELNCHLTMLTLKGIIVKLPGNMFRLS